MNGQQMGTRASSVAMLSTAAVLAVIQLAMAQNPQLEQRVAQIKQAVAANAKSLVRYTWQEQQTIIVKGDVKKQELFQVRLGPDGKPQRTLVKRIVDKKMQEYERYAQQIVALAQGYAQPDPQRLQQTYQRGDATLGAAGSDAVRLLLSSYIKPDDHVGIVFSQAQKAIQSLQISSYLDNPSDDVSIAVLFSKLSDGTTHVSSMTAIGSKQLTVHVEIGNYQKL